MLYNAADNEIFPEDWYLMSLSLHIFSIGLMHFCWTCRDLKDPTMYWEPKKKQNTSLSQLHTRNITYEKLQSCFFCPKKLISQAQRKASEGSSYTVYHQQPSPSMILARTFRLNFKRCFCIVFFQRQRDSRTRTLLVQNGCLTVFLGSHDSELGHNSWILPLWPNLNTAEHPATAVNKSVVFALWPQGSFQASLANQIQNDLGIPKVDDFSRELFWLNKASATALTRTSTEQWKRSDQEMNE